MKFYNYERLYLLSQGDPKLLIQYFKENPQEGNDFIVNESVVGDRFISEQFRAEYLGLCALRNYEDYLDRDEVDLDRDLIPPWVPVEVIADNPLIKLTHKKIVLLKENEKMISFNELNGSAKKSGIKYMKLINGDNTFRIVGGILPGYTYWVKGANGKDAPFECLQFDRATEQFSKSLPDPVSELGLKDSKGGDLRCSWSYKCQVINRANNSLEVLQLKKGMLQDIIKFAQKQKINPTDYETGCDITVTREKTGPMPFNVSYSVDPFSMQSKPLSAEDLELVEGLKAIDEIFVQETPAEQRERLQRHLTSAPAPEEAEEEQSPAELEAINELS